MSIPTESTRLLNGNTSARPVSGDAEAPLDSNVHVYCVRPMPQSFRGTSLGAKIDKESWSNLPWAFRESWLTLLRHDIGFIFSNLGSLFNTAWRALFTKPKRDTEMYNPSRVSSIGGNVMIVISGVLTIPIAATLVIAGPTYLLLHLFTRVAQSLQGPPVRHSEPAKADFVPGYERESWLFVNGIATSPSGAQATANYLQVLFHRPVVAILNRTYGAWFDLWESFLQRDLQLNTDDIRNGYIELVRHVTDPSKDRIVLIAHSQGGIIVSTWIDQLLADFDERTLSRIEVYTFASAANHFSRGGRYVVEDGKVKSLKPKCGQPAPQNTTPSNTTPSNGPFRFVEHFANTGDFVSQLGVLSHKPSDGETYGVFAGQIFERQQDGHGILDYYLGLGEAQSSILEVPYFKSRSRLASYMVTAESNGNPLPFVPPTE